MPQTSIAPSIPRAGSSALVLMDTRGRVTAMNGGAEALLSTTEEAARGRTYEAVFGPSLGSRMIPLFLHVARSGSHHDPQTLHAKLPSGRQASLQAAVGPITDGDGRLVGILFAADENVSARPPGAESARERRYLEAVRRYAGDHIALALDARPSFLNVGGRRQVVTVMHMDARGYTTVAEKLPPEQTAALLLRYHGAAVEALRAEGATFDRFVGDAVLAIWNAPTERADHARTAMRAALSLITATEQVGTELRYGIGVNTGEAVVGNLGTSSFMNYTAIGDTVNVAARLQGLAGPGEVVCSQASLDEAGPGVSTVALGEIMVKGRAAPVVAHRVQAVAS